MPERLPIINPSRVEKPIVVARLTPSRTAHRLAPLPRCAISKRRGSVSSLSAGNAPVMYSGLSTNFENEITREQALALAISTNRFWALLF